jgi:hypothetical protein
MSSKQNLLLLIPALALLSWLGWRQLGAEKSQPPKQVPSVSWVGAPPDRVVMEPELVFQRAFWRSPVAGDEIVHAERYEWHDAEGVTKWKWFLEIKPSPALISYLRDDNAFGLTRTSSVTLTDERPAWFHFDSSKAVVMRSAQTKLQLIFMAAENTLYATDSGVGMRRGAPEPANPLPSAPVPGRLPTTPPPLPKS